jgi:hypothetical protein
MHRNLCFSFVLPLAAEFFLLELVKFFWYVFLLKCYQFETVTCKIVLSKMVEVSKVLNRKEDQSERLLLFRLLLHVHPVLLLILHAKSWRAFT